VSKRSRALLERPKVVRGRGAERTSAIWFEMAVEPASPVLEHFLHPTSGAIDWSDFEPVSPALEHFLH
jgi:hypothetical protein